MTPAVANGAAFPLVRPVDGDAKNVTFGTQPYPVAIDGFRVVTSARCIVVVDGAPVVAAVSPPITAVVRVNGEPLVVVGSVVTLPSGHTGVVPPQAGAGPAVTID